MMFPLSAARITRRSSVLTAMALFAAAANPQRGRVAFHYGARFTKAQRDWFGHFEVLVTGGILAAPETQALLDSGSRLVAYEWSSAFYPGDSVSAHPAWQQTVLAHRDAWALNRDPVDGGAAEPGRPAYWYDFADPDLRTQRALHLAEITLANGYSGVFLDTLGFEQLPASLQRAFQDRHPGLDYDVCQAAFLKELRAQLGPSKILFLNQGYRRADLFLPYADYDLSESYFTASAPGNTRFHAWHDPAAPWEGIRVPVDSLIAAPARKFPRVQFVHLNYAAGTSAEIQRAIVYSYAAAKLWNHEAYLVASNSIDERNDVYFSDLGRPVDATYREDARGGLAWREFENAVVAINSGPNPATLSFGPYALLDPPQGAVFKK